MCCVNVYLTEWHTTQSPAFYDVIVEPLASFLEVRIKVWDGVSLPQDAYIETISHIFCQHLPSIEVLQTLKAKTIWLPMWDQTRSASLEWWNRLPKSLRIVAFSEAVTQLAEGAGLPTLRLRYYKNPIMIEPVSWDQGRVLLYWNRTNLVGPQFLQKLCTVLKVKKLLFRNQLDSWLSPSEGYQLPNQIGNTLVEELPIFRTRDEYLNATKEANIYVAPRAHEGIGMVFLEALARGAAVFAFNAPTMNEYISHGSNGYLLHSLGKIALPVRLKHALYQRLNQVWKNKTDNKHKISEFQNWREIRSLNLEQIGNAARQRHIQGFMEWQQQVPEYSKFVLG
ncbi:MAG: glycosyltransferase [Caldilinea sp. CFX5]|nr:glycosyltransferase [Caldilinea sp. CFX5]